MKFNPEKVKNVGLVGGGVIGGGWAVRMAIHGLNVTLYDPDPQAERKIHEIMTNASRAWRKLTMAPPMIQGKITIVKTIREAVENADIIQESAPENPQLKQKIMQEITEFCRPETPIGSSTSGILPSVFQEFAKNPERIYVAHPFNPVYLLPLLELCPSVKTDKKLMASAGEFYRSLGFEPLLMDREVEGFIADRLMESLWREALHMINENEATVSQLDDAIRFGCGMRWAFMGTFLTYRLAGGEQGMGHFMAQFGPALKWDWTRLVAPELTDELLHKIVSQSDAQAGNLSIRAMEQKRDDCLVAIMQGLKGQEFGAGLTLKRHEERLYAQGFTQSAQTHDESKDLALFSGMVLPEWCDYNQHCTEYRYLHILGDSTDAFLRYIGLDADYVAAGHSFYTVDTHIKHIKEMKLGMGFNVSTQLLRYDAKKITLFHQITDHNGNLCATGEHILVHVDNRISKSCPISAALLDNIQRIAKARGL